MTDRSRENFDDGQPSVLMLLVLAACSALALVGLAWLAWLIIAAAFPFAAAGDGGYAQSYGYHTGYGGQNETLSTLQQFYQLVRDYRVEVTITGMFLGNWIFTFCATQSFKKRLRIWLQRTLKDWEVWLMVYGISFGFNAMLWLAFIQDVSWRVVVVIGLISAVALERSVNTLMDWGHEGPDGSKRKRFYHWMRNDRRSAERPDKPPDYFTDDVYAAQGAQDTGTENDDTERRPK